MIFMCVFKKTRDKNLTPDALESIQPCYFWGEYKAQQKGWRLVGKGIDCHSILPHHRRKQTAQLRLKLL